MGFRWIGLVSGLLMALMAGCGDDNGASTTPGPSTTTHASTATSVEVGTITLVKSGGIAGVHEVTTVSATGSLTIVVPRTDSGTRPDVSTVPPDDLTRLHALVSSTEFGALAANYLPADGACCDRFMFEVTVQLGNATKAVVTADGLDVPSVLDDVVSLLDGLSAPP